MKKSITVLFSALVFTSVLLSSCSLEEYMQLSSENGQSSNPSSEYNWQINTSGSNLRDETSSETNSQAAEKIPYLENGVQRDNYKGYRELQKGGTSAEIKAYLAFVSAFDEYKTRVEFDFPITLDEMKNAYNYYRDDYPEHFWRGHSYNYSIQGDNVISFTLANPCFNGDTEKIMAAHDKLNREIKKILNAVSKKSTIEKERYIHDYLVNTCKYDIEDKSENSHNMYGAIIEKSAVCEGYATAFLYLCRLAGIECYTVKGSFQVLSGMQSHIWNIVKLEDMYYHVDVTGDDPVVNGGAIDVLEHTYFNLRDSQILKDHKIFSNTYNIDKAEGTKYNFYKYYGLEVSKADIDDFTNAYAFAAKNNYKYVEIRFTNSELLSKCPDFIMENNNKIVENANNLLKKEALKEQSHVNYMQDMDHNILSIMLEYK